MVLKSPIQEFNDKHKNKMGSNINNINIIISLLIDKLTINNNTLKEHLNKLLYEYIELNDINRIMIVVLNIALGKNNKIKTDILDYIIELSNNSKLNLISKNYIKILGKYMCCNDNIIKAKVLLLLKEIFSEIGEELFLILDFLPDKDKEYLESNLCVDNDAEDEEEEVEIDNQHLGGMNSSDDEFDETYQNIQNNNYNPLNNIENNNINNNSINNANNKGDNNANVANGAVYSENELLSTLNNLLIGNIKIRVNTIILLHEMIYIKYEENKQILIPNIDNIIDKFIKVTHELFIENDIPANSVKFAKYVSTVLLKIAFNKELISHISYKSLYDLTNELLNYLLIKDFEKIDKNSEEYSIFRSINSVMLRIIDNCDKTSIILVLLEIVKNDQNSKVKKMDTLPVKCLLKATENLGKIVNELDIKKIFNEFHIIIVNYEKIYPELNNKDQRDAIIIKFIKNFINHLVKIKKKSVMDIYNDSIKKSDIEDKYIIHWIKTSLENLYKIDKIASPNRIKANQNYNTDESIDMSNKEKISDEKKNKEKNEQTNKNEINDKKDNKNNESNISNNDNNKNEKGNNTYDQLKKKWNDIKTK